MLYGADLPLRCRAVRPGPPPANPRTRTSPIAARQPSAQKGGGSILPSPYTNPSKRRGVLRTEGKTLHLGAGMRGFSATSELRRTGDGVLVGDSACGVEIPTLMGSSVLELYNF